MIKLLYLFYFFSGATALIYELVWARRLGLIFGVDAYGIATVLTVFFTGLALGSFLFGRLIDQHDTDKHRFWPISTDSAKSALMLYGALELGIGVYAALTPLIFKFVTQIQSALFSALGNPEIFSFSLIVFILSTLVLIVPTTLMGATFPVIAKAISRMETNDKRMDANERIGTSVGLLYGFNTLGAVVGTLLAGFLLVWLIGQNLTTWLGAAVNGTIGLLAIRLAQSGNYQHSLIRSDSFKGASSDRIRSHSYVLLVVFFATGLSALALEVLWSRVLILTFGVSTYAFTVILSIFLLGIAAGSILATRFFKRQTRFATYLLWCLATLATLVIILVPILGNLPNFMLDLLDPTNTSYFQIITIAAFLSFSALILPTLIMGAAFILGSKIYLSDLPEVAKGAGSLYAVNTIGGALGAFVAGFILIPFVGIQRGLIVAAIVYLLAAALVGFYLVEKSKIRLLPPALLGFAIMAFFLLPAWNKNLLTSGASIYFRDLLEDRKATKAPKVDLAKILFYKEGLLSTIVVKQQPEGYLSLSNNGKGDASTDVDLDDMRLIGHLPMILAPNPQKTLVIGMGSGITAGAVAQHNPQVVEVAEIEEAVIEAAGYFKDYNHDILNNPNLKQIRADVRGYLASTNNKYDVITSQPSNLWVRGNANLYTREFFALCAASLNENGLMLQWIPFYNFSQNEFKTTLATFASVFPYLTVWSPVVSHDILVIGSKSPQVFDFESVKSKIQSEAIGKDLEITAISSAEIFLGHYLFDQEGLKQLLGGKIQLHTDDKPILEFSAPLSLYKSTEAENLTQILATNSNFRDHFIDLENADFAKIQKAQEAVNLILNAKLKSASDKLEESTADFEQALQILPKVGTKKELARIYFELARRASAVNDQAKMVNYFEKSIAAHPNANVYLNLAILYLSQNRLAKATEALEEAKNLQPTNPRIIEIERAVNDKKFGK